MASVSEPVI